MRAEPATAPLAPVVEPPFRFSTDDWPDTQHRQAAAEFYSAMFRQDLAPLQGHSFQLAGTIRRLPGLSVLSATACGLSSHRRAAHVSGDDVLVTLNLVGERRLIQAGREIVVREGEALISSEDGTGLMLIPEANRYITLRIPRAACGTAATPPGSVHRVERGHEGVRLLASYVRGLQDVHAPGSPQFRDLAARHVRDLALMLLPARDPPRRLESPGLAAARLNAIKQDIARALTGDLSIGAIALRHRVTPRYIQKLFESEGMTFSQYVLGARLTLAHSKLTSAAHAGAKISTIAYDAGFGDLSYFMRAFRRRYGATPSDVRAQGCTPN